MVKLSWRIASALLAILAGIGIYMVSSSPAFQVSAINLSGAVRVSAKSFHDEVMQTQQEIERVIAQNNCGLIRVPGNADMRHGSSSEGCSSSLPQSIVRPSSRGGVPVFSRAIGRFASRIWQASSLGYGKRALAAGRAV